MKPLDSMTSLILEISRLRILSETLRLDDFTDTRDIPTENPE